MPRWVRAIVVVVAGLGAARASAAAPVVDYLYIESNEGGSSGGHAALRLGDTVYHFQHWSPGVIRLQREDVARFVSAYNGLQNRAVHTTHIAASDDTRTLLQDHFNRAFLIQEKQFDIRDALNDDVRLLEFQRARADGERATYPLRGAGYFFPTIDARATAVPVSGDGLDSTPAIAPLRERIATAYGHDAIGQRAEALTDALRSLQPDGGNLPAARLSEDTLPDIAPTFSQRFGDLTLGLLALRVLAAPPPLQPGSFRSAEVVELQLSGDERRALTSYGDQLERDLTPLMRSPRPDWGYALLVGMARLVAVRESVRRGTLVVLDTFPPDAVVVMHADLEGREDVVRIFQARAREELKAARAGLGGESSPSEPTFVALEAAGNRFLELTNAAAGADLRLYPGQLMPKREAEVTDAASAPMSVEALDAAIVRARRRRDAYDDELTRLYRYHLIAKNCVSEIFRHIDAALQPTSGQISAAPPESGALLEAESQTRLGGYIQPGQQLSFIPFVSSDTVRATYRIAAADDLPSYRTRAVREMYGRENGLLVFLRESNAFTSSVYRHNADDSYFVFFTDDMVATRPLFGAVNILAGIGASAAGVALLPFDGGQTLTRGLSGTLFSVPELAFFNIRKGTFEYVPDEPTRTVPQSR